MYSKLIKGLLLSGVLLSNACKEQERVLPRPQYLPAMEFKEQVEPEKSISLLSLPEKEQKSLLEKVADSLDYTFPVPQAPKELRRKALVVNESYYEFGAQRGAQRDHKGADIYSYGADVVSLADGTIRLKGRYTNGIDFGNILVVDHGSHKGLGIESVYLHVGEMAELSVGEQVKKGQHLAKVDCEGITHAGKYVKGTKRCAQLAHLHFQIKVGDAYVNPIFFFPKYTSPETLKGKRVLAPIHNKKGKTLDEYIKP